MCMYGYIRVSSKDQNEARQWNTMLEQKITEQHIFMDKQSGKDFNRPQYIKMVRKLKAGDLVVLHSIDRLGRNYDEILEQWRIITREKKADIMVLDFPLLDTRAKDGKGDLTGKFISDLVLQTLAYVAQKEREAIHQRQAEGIAEARKRNIHFGRKEIRKPEEFPQLCLLWKEKKISAREAAARIHVSHTTFLKWVHAKNGE